MALDMSPQEKAVGDANFKRSVGQLANNQVNVPNPQGGMTRRQFMQGLVAAGATVPIAAAAYYGYTNNSFRERPVRAAVIGVGDEGGVLIGEHNPEYLEIVAICDIRPSNYENRVWRGEAPPSPRKGLNHHYGNNAKTRIKHYTNYREMLNDQSLGLEAVVIALPLHLHAPVAIDCMRAGKHVLCEKLMAWNIRQCKEMIRVAREQEVVLSIGHQRHYSLLYAHANEIVNTGILGDIHHIRALWHRNNVRPKPQADRDPNDRFDIYLDSWRKSVTADDRNALGNMDLARYGYNSSTSHTALEELVRWRLYDETGGGLMAELGSHQLDACSIFLGKRHPLSVSATGGKYYYQDDREVEDHVFCTFEFPGKNYRANGNSQERNDIVVVTYSSINTNSFEPYGECVMGTKGTLVVEEEQKAMLWGTGGRSTAMGVSTSAGGQPALESSASEGRGAATAQAVGQNALGHAPPSRGYREEMEHFAYVIRMRDQATEADRANLKVRCDGEAAMADAIMALVANKAIRTRQRIPFQDSWYRYDNNDVPDPERTARTLPNS